MNMWKPKFKIPVTNMKKEKEKKKKEILRNKSNMYKTCVLKTTKC